MEPIKDASHLYEAERRATHAERPGFRINELQISPTQQVPWHYHSDIQDTFYVIEGQFRLFLREPKEEARLFSCGRRQIIADITPLRCRGLKHDKDINRACYPTAGMVSRAR